MIIVRINKSLVQLLIPVIVFFLVIYCGEKPSVDVWKTDSGKKYEILKIGVLYSSEYGKMLTVRFKSKNIENSELRERELQDMYILVAQKMNLEEFTHVGLEAVPKGDPHFGCQQIIGYRDNKTVDEVRQLAQKLSS
jgi:hypothetical protein